MVNQRIRNLSGIAAYAIAQITIYKLDDRGNPKNRFGGKSFSPIASRSSCFHPILIQLKIKLIPSRWDFNELKPPIDISLSKNNPRVRLGLEHATISNIKKNP